MQNQFDADKEQKFWLALQNNDLSTLEVLIKEGSDINIIDQYGITPLELAIGRKEFAIVKLLLENKAEVNRESEFDITPLHLAVFRKDFAIVKLLLEHGAEVNIKNQNGETPLQTAAFKKDFVIVKLLLEHGAEVNIKNQKGETSLHKAVLSEDSAIVKLLLEHGADVNIVDQDGNTMLLYASQNPAIIKLLLAHPSSQKEREQLWDHPRHKFSLDLNYDANAKAALLKQAIYLHHLLPLAIPADNILRIAENAAKANIPEDQFKEMINLSLQEVLNEWPNLKNTVASWSSPQSPFTELPYAAIKATVRSMVNFALTAKGPLPYLPKDIMATIVSDLSPSVPLDPAKKRQLWKEYVSPTLHAKGTTDSKNLLLPITACSEKIPQKIQKNFNEALGENGEKDWQAFIKSKKQQLTQQR